MIGATLPQALERRRLLDESKTARCLAPSRHPPPALGHRHLQCCLRGCSLFFPFVVSDASMRRMRYENVMSSIMNGGVRIICRQTSIVLVPIYRGQRRFIGLVATLSLIQVIFLRQGSNELDRSCSRERSSPVMLSAAKHLAADRDRPFASLRVTWCDESTCQGLCFTIEPCLKLIN